LDQNELGKKYKMSIETEKKYRLSKEQFDVVLSSLKELNGEFIREEFEINLLYGGGILENEKALLRVRKIDDKTILTYKKQLHNQLGVKQHTEYETEVGDCEAIENIIKSLGFQLGMVYEKRRQTWHLQNVEICLDELPFGLFMEIEGKISEIGLIEMLLELEDFEVENDTYPKLTFYRGTEKDGVIEARF
jgi:adenylate cyclase, class 2